MVEQDRHDDTIDSAWVVDKPLPDARPEAILRHRVDRGHASDDGAVVDVLYSSINYKDALALTGAPGVLRSLPLVAGIDVVGWLVDSVGEISAGALVTVNGAGLGERSDGGLATRTVVPVDALVEVPDGIDARRAAAIGTAGFTAALALDALDRAGVAPGSGEVAVTGAGGGVGSFAVALLSRAGYDVAAVTGRADLAAHLRTLGATRVIGREELGVEPGSPLQKGRWAGAVDSVGGVPLANLLAQTRYGGSVAACGLAAGSDLPTTVMPFILRGVSLVGVNSVDAPAEARRAAWVRLAELPGEIVDAIAPRTEPLARAVTVARELLAGRVQGRVVIDVRA